MTKPEIIKTVLDDNLSYTSWYAMRFALQDEKPNNFENIPFISTPLFIPMIISYIVLRKALMIVFHRNNTSGSFDHVFILSFGRESKTEIFPPVIEELKDKSNILLVTRSIDKEDVSTDGRVTVALFKQLLYNVSIVDLWDKLHHSFVSVKKINGIYDENVGLYNLSIVFNYTFLEIIKSDIIDSVSKRNTSIHTMSPNPYTTLSGKASNVYYYQFAKKGAFSSGDDINKSLPFYAPVNYIVWGKRWKDLYSRQVHQNSEIHPIGSPWYEQLSHADTNEYQEDIDILFLGQDGWESENLVSELVKFSEMYDRKFRIKLHPKDTSGEWYTERGWGDYIQDFRDIKEAIGRAQVVAVDTSTGFIEASVLHTPVVVFDCKDWGISALHPAKFVVFPQDIQEGILKIDDLISHCNNSDIMKGENLVETDRVAENIAHLVSENAEGSGNMSR